MKITTPVIPQISFKSYEGTNLFKKQKHVLTGQQTAQNELNYIKGKYESFTKLY